MVVNSRPTKANAQIWRRRKCLKCDGTFTTYEKIDLSYLTVIKKSGKRQRYNRAKLYSGIYHSSLDKKNADKGELSVMSDDLTNQVEREILKMRKKEIYSIEITALVLKMLRKKAPDVFLRYLAYREGSDRGKLKRTIKRLFY
ncbi:hypothetical protein A3A76_00570 [Candidatus Woesebacteria bacterium RIFCSPLOWO2_01_FULL_39_23]|uniref:Transcriptional repressor NrdR n=1 Tax=Candidatus Woesebacteria bacterium RIFCSPHIGHO2_01_FULL_40_22 TaxID=1802499 RepID=A0A1F7YJ20_9BACT|nr:MAG: hypothetical protein A2141_05815 [Candidatus Woesebacteria bacterium RBG_16_40_11]OGM27190.1 MAG: hypothetical protein A2628_04085 [Candidatus Woesebacteria bacterium RIFCSPHIGHO2_01_FULL_40_22]OGM36926.1 MAG: hypothetical protein A3E41_05135 [Candidatus Woesebacteria bacterium RIFCSPHIGHO2_12_FULL_38_9]OGM63356.1 MAG: hypothetical protein A3A76_00570 [Candidatus Woesebacteria bacterium RIFCSPLOWO2_01_FULL_39_23]